MGLSEICICKVRPKVNIARTIIYPDISDKSVRVKTILRNRKKSQTTALLALEADGKRMQKKVTLQPGTNEVDAVLSLGDEIRLWDEFHPNLYQLKVSLTDEEQNTTDPVKESFGMRDFKVVDGCITVNNRPVFYVVRWIVPLFQRPVIRLLTKKPGKEYSPLFRLMD